MANIILVNPKIYDTLQNFNYLYKLNKVKFVAPPLALITIASLIPKEHNVKIIDENTEPLTQDLLQWADMAMITGILMQQNTMEAVIRKCKKAGVKVLIGGLQARNGFERYEDLVDHIFIGESENIIPQFFNDLKNSQTSKVYEETNQVELENAPIPRHDLVKFKDYLFLSIQFSRGCPNKCDYCELITFYGRKVRHKSIENFIKELQLIYDLGYRGGIMVADDNFHRIKKPVLKELLESMIAWQKSLNYPFRFFSQTDITVAEHPDILELMQQASFSAVQIGIESVSAEALKAMNKTWNISKDIKKAVETIHRAGIEVNPAIILGSDGDPEDISPMLFEFLSELGTPRICVSLLIVAQHTPLYKRINEQGRLIGQPLCGDGDIPLNYKPLSSEKKVVMDRIHLVEKLFSPKNYFKRLEALNKTLSPRHMYSTTNNSRIKWKHIARLMAFFMLFSLKTRWSLFHIEYSKFILKTILFQSRDSGVLNKTASVGIAGYQFYRTYKEHAKRGRLYLEKGILPEVLN